jgi:hypothetical protein
MIHEGRFPNSCSSISVLACMRLRIDRSVAATSCHRESFSFIFFTQSLPSSFFNSLTFLFKELETELCDNIPIFAFPTGFCLESTQECYQKVIRYYKKTIIRIFYLGAVWKDRFFGFSKFYRTKQDLSKKGFFCFDFYLMKKKTLKKSNKLFLNPSRKRSRCVRLLQGKGLSALFL